MFKLNMACLTLSTYSEKICLTKGIISVQRTVRFAEAMSPLLKLGSPIRFNKTKGY